MKPMALFSVLCMLLMAAVPECLCAGSFASRLSADVARPDLSKSTPDDLVVALKDSRMNYRSAAAQEIGKRRVETAVDDLKPLLRDAVPFVRVDAAESLLALGDKSGLQTLRGVLADQSTTPATALRAALILAKAGDETGQARALTELSSKYFSNRMAALHVLKESKNPDVAYAAMRTGLADSNEYVRRAAFGDLGRMGTVQSLEMLQAAFGSTKDPLERSAIVHAVEDTWLWDAVPLLIDALGDTSSVVRGSADAGLCAVTGQKFDSDLHRNAEKSSELQRQWREWWDANKTNYAAGTRSTVPKPVRHYDR